MTTHNYFPTFNFEITDEPNKFVGDFTQPSPDIRFKTDNLIRGSSSCVFVPSKKITLVTECEWEQTNKLNTHVGMSVENADRHDSVTMVQHGQTINIDSITSANNEGNFKPTHTVCSTNFTAKLPSVDVSTKMGDLREFKEVDSTSESRYYNILPYVDVGQRYTFSSVYVRDPDKLPNPDFKYYHQQGSVADFNWGDELNPNSFDFEQPINHDAFKTRMSPVGSCSDLPWKGLGDLVSGELSLPFGNSLNNFVIANPITIPHDTEEGVVTPPEPPVDQPEFKEVIRIVNIVNVVVLPERTPINFTNLTLAIDLQSVAWVGNFDIADQASLNLIKPQGLTVKEVEVDINGDKFVLFIGRTSTSVSSGSDGVVQRRIKCTGWSNTKRLSYPYSQKRSHTELSSATPAGLVNDELSGTGFTASWDTVSWTIPPKVFGYLDKAPLAAISELVSSVGAVVIPTKDANSLTVKPYYPVSPWNWDTETPDRVLIESAFFTMDTEWVPHESPDSIYIYGEENGVGVKCIKSGTAGIKTLPTIVDKHITDTVAGGERGRIEVAKNGFKEIIPITTYVDENGIIMPQELLSVFDADNNEWRGMVVGTALSIKRNGNALVQSLQVERHYE